MAKGLKDLLTAHGPQRNVTDFRCDCTDCSIAGTPQVKSASGWKPMARSNRKYKCYFFACRQFCTTVANTARSTQTFCREGKDTYQTFMTARTVQEVLDKDTCLKVDPLCHRSCAKCIETGDFGADNHAPANLSHWPQPQGNVFGCYINFTGSYCAVEAQMRLCCNSCGKQKLHEKLKALLDHCDEGQPDFGPGGPHNA